MYKVTFKNLKQSLFAKKVVETKLEETIQRFPDLKDHKLAVTLSMENSPQQAGPDVFGIRLFVSGKKFKNLVLEKKASNLYRAISKLFSTSLEVLNRRAEKMKSKRRKQFKRNSQHKWELLDSTTGK